MIDIKPDTSLYTDLPSRLRAMALVLEGPRERMQIKGSKSVWGNPVSSWEDRRRVKDLAFESTDYRLKPAPPAKLYVNITDGGQVVYADVQPHTPMPGTTRVTYVLEIPMRTVDEDAALILSDPASSEQLRRLATAVVDRTDTATIEDMDAQVREAENAMEEAEGERDAAKTRAEGLQRDLEADKRQSAALRQMLEGANDLLSKSHHTGAIEWRSQYLAGQT